MRLPPIPEMTAQEFRTALDLLFGGGQVEAARWLDLSQEGRTLRRWAAGSVPVSKAVAILFRLMVNCQVDPDLVRRSALLIIPHEEEDSLLEEDSA